VGLHWVFGLYTQQEFFGFISIEPVKKHEFRKDLEGISEFLSKVALRLYRLETIEQQKEMSRLSTLGEMSSGLAHEIRNPLGAIKGAAQLLAKNDQMDSRFVRIILEETQRLNRVVTQFLDYSKPLKVSKIEFDLITLCQETVLLMNTEMPVGIELIFESAVIEAKVFGDPDQLKQVFINLLQNALRAVQAVHALKLRETQIIFSVDKPAQSHYWLVRITDNGVGIKQEDLEKIFIPFYTTDLQGTGLGLPVSYRLIKAHGGEMKVDSEFGVGTRIEILIPQREVSL
jgi:signal transduction histidine kinase